MYPFRLFGVHIALMCTRNESFGYISTHSQLKYAVIRKLCTDNAYREEVVRKCHERALQYDIQKMVEGCFEAYREIF